MWNDFALSKMIRKFNFLIFMDVFFSMVRMSRQVGNRTAAEFKLRTTEVARDVHNHD